MLSWFDGPVARLALGACLGLAGVVVSLQVAPLVQDTLFMAPAIMTVIAILVVGGFWPAFIASTMTWGATVWFLLEPIGSFRITSTEHQIKVVIAFVSFAAGCYVDAWARRERKRLRERERNLLDSESRNQALFSRAAEERDLLEAVLATSDAAVVVVSMPDRRVLFANKQFVETFRTTREALVRDGIASLELEYAGPAGEPLPPGPAPAAMVQTRGDAVHDARLHVRRPGDPWRLFSINAAPLRNADGEISAIVYASVDITERTATQSALSLSEERLRRLTDAVPGCVYQFRLAADGQRAFTFVSGGMRSLLQLPNAASLPSFDESWSMVAPEERERVARSIEESARALARWTEEFPALLADGTRKWIRGTAVPDPPLPDGSIVWNGLLLDITDRKRLEDDLLQVQKMESIGRLAGGVAHDFNNILTAIRGNVDLLLESMEPDHPHGPELHDIQQAAERATALTRQLLAFSRKQAMQARPIELGALVRDMEKMLRRVIGEDIVLLTTPSEDIGTVRADPGQLEQVLMNLAVNARDAMPEGGLLTIETRAVQLEVPMASALGISAGDYVSLVVRDTGHGMDDATRARIFDPFFTTKPAGKGTGLGLAMVYGIVRQSGGAISVDTAVGRGATFRIYLPRAPRAPNRQLERFTPPSVEAASLPIGATILLVEDDAAVRALTRRMLHQSGFVVRDAADAYEALTTAGPSCDGIAAVVTDVIMPGMGGRDLVRELRSRRADVRVLYISGYLDIDAQRLELDARTRLLAKPFSRDDLLRHVAALVDREVASVG
jgi:signal transduction histidine kinase/ActR/RegA family two-component response regulator